MVGIYKYTNKKNGKIYIGRSVDISHRKWEHLHHPSPYSYFDQTLIAIGEEAFDFEVVEECAAEELMEKEQYWIAYYNCCVLDGRDNGYNLTRGGEEYRSENNPWAKLSLVTVKEIIEKLKNTKISMQKLSEEYGVHRNTISDINRCKTWAWAHEYKENIRKEAQGSVFCGEFSGTNVVPEERVIEIIEDIKNSNLSLAAIGRKYGIKDSLVYDINRCKTWKHLHNYQKNIRNEFRKEGDAK